MTYLAVSGMDTVPRDNCGAAEMRITLFGMSLGPTLGTRLSPR
jgi:hypothetical protein